MHFVSRFVLAVLMFAASACVLGPADGHQLDSRTDLISFQGYGTEPNSDIILRAKNFRTGQMEEIARTKTQVRVGIKENNWGTHPALHYWSIQARVATGSAQYAR